MPAAFASMSKDKDRGGGDRWGKGDGDRGGYQATNGASQSGGWNPRATSGGSGGGGGGSNGARWSSHNVEDSEVEALFRCKQDSGINFDKYDDIPVELSGPDPVKPIETYDNLSGIHEILRENIRRAGCALSPFCSLCSLVEPSICCRCGPRFWLERKVNCFDDNFFLESWV